MCIREPAADGNGVLGVEDVGCGRVVDDDGVFQIPPDLRQVLDVVALVVVAALAEQPVVDNLVDVQLVQQGIAILEKLRLGTGWPVRQAEQGQAAIPWRTEAVKTTTS